MCPAQLLSEGHGAVTRLSTLSVVATHSLLRKKSGTQGLCNWAGVREGTLYRCECVCKPASFLQSGKSGVIRTSWAILASFFHK